MRRRDFLRLAAPGVPTTVLIDPPDREQWDDPAVLRAIAGYLPR